MAYLMWLSILFRGLAGSMSQVAGSNNSSYKPITNMAWVCARLCKLQKGCTRLAAASEKVYQLLPHGRWFSPPSSTTKTGRHDIAEILLKVALKHQKLKKKSILFFFFFFGNGNSFSFYSDITKERLFLNIYTMPCVNKQQHLRSTFLKVIQNFLTK